MVALAPLTASREDCMQMPILRLSVALATAGIALVASGTGARKHHFSVNGAYLEGCSCGAPCKCELTGIEMGCQGVGAFTFTGGSYDGRSLAGVRTAYATKPGEWVMIYVDAPNTAKRATGEQFMRNMLAAW